MPTPYHGTSLAHAATMAGTPANGQIDVTIGGGEFGRGFYTQSSPTNASRRGGSIYGVRRAVLRLSIDDACFETLRQKRLTLDEARALDRRLIGPLRNAYTTADDVIVGPLLHKPRIEQQKFQSPRAQALLNGELTARTVLG